MNAYLTLLWSIALEFLLISSRFFVCFFVQCCGSRWRRRRSRDGLFLPVYDLGGICVVPGFHCLVGGEPRRHCLWPYHHYFGNWDTKDLSFDHHVLSSMFLLVILCPWLQSPASIVSPRGLITLPPNKPFSVGAVKKEGDHVLLLLAWNLLELLSILILISFKDQ